MNNIENGNLITDNKIVADFEKLLALAEESSKEIDSLLQVREKQRMGLLFKTAIIYGVGIITFLAINYFPRNLDRELYALACIAIIVLGSLFSLYKNFFLSKKINRELQIERSIHEKLISMLDIQKQRLYENEILSSVAYAIYEIRLQRLDRTDKKIY